MASIFISYRRADAQGHAQNLHHRLLGWFEARSELFFDSENIDSGQDFPQRLTDAIDDAAVVLVLIGPGWLSEINRRVSLPEVDFVRAEVEAALRRLRQDHAMRVIPVLMGGTVMPSAGALAASLQGSIAPLCAIDAHDFQSAKQDDWEHQFLRLRGLIAAVPNAPRERYRDRSGRPRPLKLIEHALSPSFQDPTGLLTSLRAQLHGGGGTAAVVGAGSATAAALHGMGGIGKTQLALAYCLSYRDAYAGIWWLRANTVGQQGDTLLQQDALAACAAAGVAVPRGVAPSLALKQWLGSQSAPWLLVFDNADDPSALRPSLPGPGPHHAVITSRRPDWGALAKTVELSTWTPRQGANFLVHRLGDATPLVDAAGLTQELGGLPLALEQAASYVEATGSTLSQYMRLWQTAAAELLNRPSVSTGYEHTVGATLSLAFTHLSTAAQQLLCLCAFAAPEQLPERFFTERHELLPTELGAAAAKPMAWNDVAGELRRYALAQRDAIPSLDRTWLAGGQAPEGTPTESALTLHRLTQQVVRDQLAEPQHDGVAMQNLLAQACPGEAQDPVQWPRLAALLPHAVWLNDSGSMTLTDESVHVQIRTSLLDRVASYLLYGLALYPQARSHFAHALAVRLRLLGEEHPATLTSMNHLAETLRAQGDLAGAHTLQEQALARSRRLLGKDHPGTLTSMNNLALTLLAQGELADARTLQEHVLAGRRVPGEEELDTAISMINLAETLRVQGDLAGARTLQEQALAVCHRLLGEEHPRTLLSTNNLANTLCNQRDLAGARRLHDQVLAVCRRVLGEEHPETLCSMNNLAETLRALGDLAGARTLLEQVLEVCRRVFGEEHPDTLCSMSNLGNTLRDQGDLAGARNLQEPLLAVCCRVLGEEHPNTLTLMSTLAGILAAQGDLAGARALQQQALTGRRRLLGDEHLDTIALMNDLGQTLWQQGDLPCARSQAEQVLAVRRRVLGEEHPDTLCSTSNLASVIKAQGDLAGARILQEQALAVCRRVLGEEHHNTLTSMSSLAGTLGAQGDLAGAQSLQKQALAGRRRLLGEEHPSTIASMNDLGKTLWNQGDLPGARCLAEQVLAVRRRVLGEAHPITLSSMNNLADTLRAQRDLTGARILQEQALAVCRRVLGEDHLDTLTSMSNLAGTLGAQRDFAGANSLQEQALAGRRRLLGEEHPATIASMNDLGQTLWNQGDLPGARCFAEQVLAVRRRVLGEEHPVTLSSMSNLAGTLRAAGDLAGARILQEQALAVCRRVLGEEHPDTLTSMNNLAVTLGDQGQRDDASALMTLVVQGRATTLGPEHADTNKSAMLLAQMRNVGV